MPFFNLIEPFVISRTENPSNISFSLTKENADAQGSIYGSVYCRTLLLQTPSGVYENHLLNSLIDPKTYGTNLTVPNWFTHKTQRSTCAQWF